MIEEFVAHILLDSESLILPECIESISPFADKILIARAASSFQIAASNDARNELISDYGGKVEMFSEDFPDRQAQILFLRQKSQERRHKGAFLLNGDEVGVGNIFLPLFQFILGQNPPGVKIPRRVFIKDARFCVSAPHEAGLFYVNLKAPPEAQENLLAFPSLLGKEPGIFDFFFTPARDEEIISKIRWRMAEADQPIWMEWYKRMFLNFHPSFRNFHPLNPTAWSALERFEPGGFPSRLRCKLEALGKLPPRKEDDHLKMGLDLEEAPPGSGRKYGSENEKTWGSYEEAQALIDQGEMERAIRLLESLLPFYPWPSAAQDDLGALYFQKGDWERALGYFLLAVQTNPYNLNAKRNLADLLLAIDRFDEAVQVYRDILSTVPNDPEAVRGVANACEAKGRGENTGFIYAGPEKDAFFSAQAGAST